MSQSEDELGDSQWSEDEHETRAEAPALRLGVGVHDVSLAAYLADPCEQPSLRSSDINTMLRLRPAHVKALHPRLSDSREFAIRKATSRMDLGSVVHELVLGKGGGFCVIDPANFITSKGEPSKSKNTKLYKEAHDAAVAQGLIVLDPKQSDAAQRISDRIAAKLASIFGSWPIAGVTEQTFIWQEETPAGKVWCRTRPDIAVRELALVVDLKSCGTGLSDDDLQRTMSGGDGGMFVQSAWQRRGVTAVWPELAGRLHPTTHVFVETELPYEPRPIDASAISLVQADRRCVRGAEMFAQCIADDSWPAWPRGIVSAAQWLDTKWTNQEEEAMA